MAADDVATAVADAALAPPLNGTVEIAGPEPFYIDELVGKVLAYDKDRARSWSIPMPSTTASSSPTNRSFPKRTPDAGRSDSTGG